MQLKPSRVTFCGAIALLLCFSYLSYIAAQDIGHLGVNTDPIPLVQAKRPQRKSLVRNLNRNQTQLANSRPNPASKDLRAEVGEAADKNPNNKAPVKGKDVAVKSEPKVAPKPAAPSFDDFVANAEEQVGKGQLQAAAVSFREALKIEPNSLDAQLALADVLHDAKDYLTADAEYQKILAKDPQSIEAHRGRGDTLYELNRYLEAVSEYEAALKQSTTDAGLYNNLANAYFRTGTRENRERAIEHYRKAISLQPRWPDAYAGLANVLRSQKRLAEAKQAVETSLQLAPQSPLGHSVASRVYADLNDFSRANAEGQKAVQLAPQDAFVYVNLGGIFYAQKRFDEAVQAYLKAQALDRTWAFPHNSLGNVYLTTNRPKEAINEFRSAAQLEPKSPIIHNNLGNAHLILQQYDAAIENYRIAATLDPKNPNPHSNMGVALIQQGRIQEAVAAFKRATEIDPNNNQFRQALADAQKMAGGGKDEKKKKKK